MKTKRMNHLLESVLSRWRIRKILPDFPSGGILYDIGCGDPPMLINAVKDRVEKCVGIDIVASGKRGKGAVILKQDLKTRIKLLSASANVVTLLAVLEHLDHPREIIVEIFRLLKPGGKLLLTVPSPMSALPLSILAKINWVDPVMIAQHKNYFTHVRLKDLLSAAGFKKIKIISFQMGLNTYAQGIK